MQIVGFLMRRLICLLALQLSMEGFPEQRGILYNQENSSSFIQPISLDVLMTMITEPSLGGLSTSLMETDAVAIETLQNIVAAKPKVKKQSTLWNFFVCELIRVISRKTCHLPIRNQRGAQLFSHCTAAIQCYSFFTSCVKPSSVVVHGTWLAFTWSGQSSQ